MPVIRTLALGTALGLSLATACSSSDPTPATSTTAAPGSSTTVPAPGTSTPGTSTPGTSSPGTSAPSTTVPGSITDPAVPIRATVGQEFTITVESNPTTGYTWNVTGNPADSIAVPIGNTPTSTGPMPGQGGTETFTFKASGPGTTKITLTYARSFDPTDNPTVNEYTLVVTG